jgi:eukaryotic-like serine/threonine-protein kinase
MVAGKVIFARRTMVAAMSAILKDPAPSLSGLGVTAPPALEAVMRRAVAKTPDERFQSASEIVDALRML